MSLEMDGQSPQPSESFSREKFLQQPARVEIPGFRGEQAVIRYIEGEILKHEGSTTNINKDEIKAEVLTFLTNIFTSRQA